MSVVMSVASFSVYFGSTNTRKLKINPYKNNMKKYENKPSSVLAISVQILETGYTKINICHKLIVAFQLSVTLTVFISLLRGRPDWLNAGAVHGN